MQPASLENWYHHNLNPFAFSINGVAIPWYWLVYVAGWFWCDYIGRKTLLAPTTSNEQTSINAKAFHSFMLWGWIGMLVGARLGYIFLYNLQYYLHQPDQIFAIWNGGMSFHGGLIGVAIAALATSRQRGISIFALTDPIATAMPPVIFLGRLANFLNGELPGRLSTAPWAVVFPAPYDEAPRHPSQLYEACAEGLVVGLVLLYLKGRLTAKPGALSFAFLGLYSIARFFVEFTREPDPQLGLIHGLSMGQWLSMLALSAAIIGLSQLASSKNA